MRLVEHLRRTPATIAIVISMISWGGADGQSVHGVVRGVVSGAPLSGVVVVLRDSLSSDVAQAVTNSSGTFVVRARAGGSYTLRARYIGFRPSEMRLRLSPGDTTIVVTMTEVPTALATVVTRRTGQCRVHPESGSATWSLWENTEIALLNAAITRRDRAYRFDAEFTRRWYDMDHAKLTEMALRDSTIRDRRPWTSVRPEILQRSGFAVESATEMTVIAPDLPVLLSPDFLDRHCFAIHAASNDHPELIGLDFVPVVKGRYVDIRGTFWLDQQSGDLRYLDYYYAGFPFSMSDTLAGGRVGFTKLSTGSWVLSSWFIRAPVPAATYLEQTALMTPFPSRAVQADDPHFRSIQFSITGGAVREVRGDGGTESRPIWSAPVSRLRVNVAAQSASGVAPVAGATVMLAGSRRQAVSDSGGVALIDGLMVGDYIVDVTSPLQAQLRLTPTRMTVTVAPPSDAELHALVMSTEQALHAACGDMNPTRGILVGTVTRDGVPQPRAHVIVRSEAEPGVPGREVRASDDGTFRVCDLPRGEELTLVAMLADPTHTIAARTRAKIRVTISTDHKYETVDMVLPPDR